eukprot:symbB.v1.2.014976.t2/scaffold1107.1/size155946/10
MWSKRINIWESRFMRPDKWLCNHPYHEVKFTRPYWLGRRGFPNIPRSNPHEIGRKGEKYCDMSKIHQQETRKNQDIVQSQQVLWDLAQLAVSGVCGPPSSPYDSLEHVSCVDVFISHNWSCPSALKYLAMCHYLNLDLALISSSATAIVTALILILRAGSVTGVAQEGVAFLCGALIHWPMSVFLLAYLFGHVGQVFAKQSFWFDRICVDQNDMAVKEQTLQAIPAFVAQSKQMLILWDSTYFQRLWCLYEIAVSAKTSTSSFQKEQFARCSVESDREVIFHLVGKLFAEEPLITVTLKEICGEDVMESETLSMIEDLPDEKILNNFNIYVRGPLRESLLQSMGEAGELPFKLCLVILLPCELLGLVFVLGCDGHGCETSASYAGYSSVSHYFLTNSLNNLVIGPIFTAMSFPVMLRTNHLVSRLVPDFLLRWLVGSICCTVMQFCMDVLFCCLCGLTVVVSTKFSTLWLAAWIFGFTFGDFCGCLPLRQLGETLKRRWDLWRGDSSRSWLGRKEYWDAAYASGRYKHTYEWNQTCETIWPYLMKVLEKDFNSNILHILWISLDPSCVLNVDYSPVVIKMMQQSQPDLQFLCADCAEMGILGEERYDFCVDKGAIDSLFESNSSFMWEQGCAMIREIHRALKPGGKYLVISNGGIGSDVLKATFSHVESEEIEGYACDLYYKLITVILCTKDFSAMGLHDLLNATSLPSLPSRRYASFLEPRTLQLPEELPAGVCQKFVLTDGLHDLVFGIPEWRHYKSEWMAGRKSAPLGAMSHADYGLLLQARKHFIKAREQLLFRDYHPNLADRKKLAKDPADFFKTTTSPVVKEIGAGLTLVKKVVQQQKGAEFEDSIHLVDYATRRRQLMTLENIQALATTISEMAKQCAHTGAKELLRDAALGSRFFWPPMGLTLLALTWPAVQAAYVVSVQNTLALKEMPIFLNDENPSGCTVKGMEVVYNCISSSGASNIAQRLKFRVDCRGAKGDFENLTLYDEATRCGVLDYRLYSHTHKLDSNPHPFPGFTFYKEDVFDIQCVLLTFESMINVEVNITLGNSSSMNWPIYFELRQDATNITRQIQGFNLRLPSFEAPEMMRGCEAAMKKGHDWKMQLRNSTGKGNTHLLSLSSPTFQEIEILPKISSSFESGDIFAVDKHFLHASVKRSTVGTDLVKLDANWEGFEYLLNSFSLLMKLNVEASKVSPDTRSVHVTLGVKYRKDEDDTKFTLELPIFPDSEDWERSHSFRWFWLIVFLILAVVLGALGYVYWELLTKCFSRNVVVAREREVEMGPARW